MSNDKNLFDLQLDLLARDHLKASAKWAKFLAIVGLLFMALLIVVSLVVAFNDQQVKDDYAIVESNNAEIIGTIVGSIMIFVIYFFPCLFMIRFANKMQLAGDDTASLNEAFKNLKITLRYFGVITIISLALLFLGLLVELFGN